MDRRSFLQRSVVTAAIIGFPCIAVATTGKDGTILDLAEAVRLMANKTPELTAYNPPELTEYFHLDLDRYLQATPDALEYLAGQGYYAMVSVGIAELDENNARILAKLDCNLLIFCNIKYLDSKVAAILSDSHITLSFERLMVSQEVARELGRVAGHLELRMDSISLDVANELVTHSSKLNIFLRLPPSREVLHVLCSHAGYALIVFWAYQPGNALLNLVLPNEVKTVHYKQYQFFDYGLHDDELKKYDGEWFESVEIYEDFDRCHAGKYVSDL